MSESEHEEWTKGFCSNGGYLPDEDMGWNQFIGENKELTMWDIVVEMLVVAQGKVSAFASSSTNSYIIPWVSSHLLELLGPGSTYE